MKTSLSQVFADLTPEKFMIKHFAADKNNRYVDPLHPEAAKWCSMGWVVYKYKDHQARLIFKRIKEKFCINYITCENDLLGYYFIEQLQSMTEEFEIPSEA
ncbi:MAG: hypothetical protein MN733_24905 [Nitrososphaera sp.]|nr:hypothetical protein [Nitrososphaera sp.]